MVSLRKVTTGLPLRLYLSDYSKYPLFFLELPYDLGFFLKSRIPFHMIMKGLFHMTYHTKNF